MKYIKIAATKYYSNQKRIILNIEDESHTKNIN